MKPVIDGTKFGWIQIEGCEYNHDVIIDLAGKVRQRRKSLSKAIYGTSHTVSLLEIQYIFEDGAEELIIGSGQYDVLDIADEAREYVENNGVAVTLLPTSRAIEYWNDTNKKCIGIFHVGC